MEELIETLNQLNHSPWVGLLFIYVVVIPLLIMLKNRLSRSIPDSDIETKKTA